MRLPVVLVLLLVIPLLLPPCSGMLPTHQSELVADKFSDMLRDNVTVRSDGALELASGSAPSTEVLVTGDQELEFCPAVEVGPNDIVYLAWRDTRNGRDDIYCGRLDAGLKPIGAAIAVCTGFNGNKDTPDIAVDPQGNFIVVWEDDRNGVGAGQVFGQLFDPSGNKSGSEFRISGNGSTAGDPRVATWPDGSFVVTWDEMRTALNTNIYARIFFSNGTPNGNEIPVCTAAEHQFEPKLALNPITGEFIIAWWDWRTDLGDILARRFYRNGTVLQDLSLCSDPGEQSSPEIAYAEGASTSTKFIATWLNGTGTSIANVVARRFMVDGVPDGPIFSIGKSYRQRTAKVAIGPGGDFAVAWTEDFVYAQKFRADLTPDGAPVKFSTSNDSMISPALARTSRDNYVVVWTDMRGSTNDDLYARLLLSPATYKLKGTVTTLNISAGPFFVKWYSVGLDMYKMNATANTITLEWSTDGVSWKPVPLSSLIEEAGTAPGIRLRATLATTDNSSSPVLNALRVRYLINHPPTVTLPPTMDAFVGINATIVANGTDLDGDPLNYTWSQLTGPAAVNTSSSISSLLFRFLLNGTYSLAVKVSDGFCESLPAFITVTVKEPAAQVNPTCIIDFPANGSTVAGTIRVRGRAQNGTNPLERVEVRVDERIWTIATGKETWNLTLKFSSGDIGLHRIEARAIGGTYSETKSVNITVVGPGSSTTSSGFPWWILLVILLLLAAYAGAVLYARRRRARI